ncbi:MAG: hypothetical protein COA78_05890 [Blastopirellula sp.]|nr:MAG: hypothetical protein COA78_05890 [Blastopirellula sp.]
MSDSLTSNNTTTYEFSRLAEMTQWGHWAAFTAVVIGILAYVIYCYRRDALELPRATGISLTCLRILAFVALLFVFLGLEKKTEREVLENSRVIVMVDTSQSMGLQDPNEDGSSSGVSRIQQIVSRFTEGELLTQLTKYHQVLVYRFDEAGQPQELADFPKTGNKNMSSQKSETLIPLQERFTQTRQYFLIALGICGVAVLGFLIAMIVRALGAKETAAYISMIGTLLLIIGMVTAAVINLQNPDLSITSLVEGKLPSVEQKVASEEPTAETRPSGPAIKDIDWSDKLLPRGVETRIGDALVRMVNNERGGPIAGIILLTDGVSNAGININEAALAAAESGIRVFPIGLGSDIQPVNIRVVDLEAPPRVYPGDAFRITGYIQAIGMSQEVVRVQLAGGQTDADGNFTEETIEEERRVQLGESGEVLSVLFEVTPEIIGFRSYQLRVFPNSQSDHNEKDNEKQAKVRIIKRKNRVLLIAGGPLREFRFLRNQLYRDKDVELDVYLQSGKPGISQESDKLLFEFPEDAATLFENYDCIVAFDPDWSALSLEQAELLERWVAEKSGGLIVVAGPVNTPEWASLRRGDPVIDVIKGLYPVSFHSRGTSIGLGRFGNEKAWPVSMTVEGLQSEFLWLDDDGKQSKATWEEFEGVYGYYAVKGVKPGGNVYARYENPDATYSNESPIYMAGHFYGSGRVFFMASAEMWRIRALDDAHFEKFYTKLIRHVSQGRLLRDSSRGVLLVNKDRALLGETIEVRAHLTDEQYDPLNEPLVNASLISPDGSRSDVQLRQIQQSGKGQYSGQFNTLIDGDYRLELQLSGTSEDSLLTREVRVRVPDLEIENPQRDDVGLKLIADTTGADYYVGLDAALGKQTQPAVYSPNAETLPPHNVYTSLPDLLDRDFDRLLRSWLLGIICGILSLEWIIRRLSKLA